MVDELNNAMQELSKDSFREGVLTALEAIEQCLVELSERGLTDISFLNEILNELVIDHVERGLKK